MKPRLIGVTKNTVYRRVKEKYSASPCYFPQKSKIVEADPSESVSRHFAGQTANERKCNRKMSRAARKSCINFSPTIFGEAGAVFFWGGVGTHMSISQKKKRVAALVRCLYLTAPQWNGGGRVINSPCPLKKDHISLAGAESTYTFSPKWSSANNCFPRKKQQKPFSIPLFRRGKQCPYPVGKKLFLPFSPFLLFSNFYPAGGKN